MSIADSQGKGEGRPATHQGQRSLVQDLLPGLPDKVERTREADGGDLALDMLWVGGNDMGVDGQGTDGDVLAHLPQSGEVVGVDGQLVDGDVIWGLGGVRPPEDCIGSSVEDILGVWAGQVGGEGDVEGMVDDRVADLRRCYGRDTHSLWVDFVVRMVALHRHGQIGPRGHAKGGTHPL